MVALTLVFVCGSGLATPFERLTGFYKGPMNFVDLSAAKKDRSMHVRLNSVASADSVTMTFEYWTDPRNSSKSTYICKPSADGRRWTETGADETLTFDLTGWADFAAGKTDWFLIERPTDTGRFRRKWRVTEVGLTSLKWLKTGDGPWDFNHKMDLRR